MTIYICKAKFIFSTTAYQALKCYVKEQENYRKTNGDTYLLVEKIETEFREGGSILDKYIILHIHMNEDGDIDDADPDEYLDEIVEYMKPDYVYTFFDYNQEDKD